MLKKTDELDFELEKSKSIHDYIKANETEFNNNNFCDFLRLLISESGKSKTKLISDACISEPYLYDVLRGDRHPSRNTVIKLAFGLGVSLKTAERLLMLAGYSSFYVRNKRDALLKYAFQKGMDISDADILMAKYGFSLMTE